MAVPLLGSIALGGVQAGYGLYKLNQLGKTPNPNYTVSDELSNAYKISLQNAQRGFSPEERAVYDRKLSNLNRSTLTNALNQSGGNLSSAIRKSIRSQTVDALGQVNLADANLQRQQQRYSDSLGMQIQQQKNMATSQDITNRRLLEQAYGGAVQSGLMNLAGGLNYRGIMGAFGGNTSIQGYAPQNQSMQINPVTGAPNNYATTGWGLPYGGMAPINLSTMQTQTY